MRLTEEGNVGIGTTAPATKLEVIDDSSGGIRLSHANGEYVQMRNSGTVAYLENTTGPLFVNSGADLRLNATTYDSDIYLDANGFIKFRESGVDIMAIDGGNVGIGTTSPSQKLHVYGKIKLEEANGGTVLSGNYGYFKVSPTNNYGVLVENSLDAAKYFSFGVPGDYGQIRYKENNSSAISVSATGVGIGTTSPNTKLQVAGDIRADYNIIFSGTGFINNNTGS